MKVTEVIVRIEPAQNETKEPRILTRTPDKRWTTDGGMYSGEVKLAALIEEAINRWGG